MVHCTSHYSLHWSQIRHVTIPDQLLAEAAGATNFPDFRIAELEEVLFLSLSLCAFDAYFAVQGCQN